jgi:6-pyruvoyltetrahydropterin/6-carboxytetrahydropterin synthase
MLEVTVSGEVDPNTGMVINLFDLKRVLLAVLEEFDHKNLNLDMPYFASQIPTSENLARVLWTKLVTQQDIGVLHAITLHEDEDLCAEVTAAAGLDVASVTRRYSFIAGNGTHEGRDPVTGMVTDLGVLDRLVQDTVLKKFDHQDLRAFFDGRLVSGETLVKEIWHALETSTRSGVLSRVRLVESRDLFYECSG